MIIKIINQLLTIIFIIKVINPIQVQQHLPALRQTLQPDISKTYQVQQSQTFNLYSSPQSQIIGKLYKQCHVHDPYIKIQTIKHFDKVNKDKKYLYNSKLNCLMILDDTELIIQPLDQAIQRQEFKFSSNCSKDMVLEYGREKAFIFSCQASFVVNIDKNSIVVNSVLKNQEELDIRKAMRFKELVILITYSKGVFIYGIDLSLNLRKVTHILPTKGEQKLQIVDAHQQNDKLLLLDSNMGLLFYKKQQSSFIFHDSLSFELQEQIQYSSLQIWKNNIFISIQAQTQSMVAQFQQMDSKYYLIRYYKGYDQIIKMQIVNSSLIIHSNYKIDVFPINRDPRIIKSLLNGYTYLHDQAMISFHYLHSDIFLIQRPNSAIITQWTYKNKKIQCEFKETGTYTILLQQPCQSNPTKQFNQVCQQVEISQITVYHKDTYIWLLLISIGIFIAITLSLIYWRQNKVARIMHILKQIKGFELKKKEIEFKEVNLGERDITQQKQQQQQREQMDPYQQYINSQRNNLT